MRVEGELGSSEGELGSSEGKLGSSEGELLNVLCSSHKAKFSS